MDKNTALPATEITHSQSGFTGDGKSSTQRATGSHGAKGTLSPRNRKPKSQDNGVPQGLFNTIGCCSFNPPWAQHPSTMPASF